MTTETAALPTPDEFGDWMTEECFTDRTLAAALGCHFTTVWKWRTDRTNLNSISWIACRAVAGNARARERRRKSLEAIALADQQSLAAMRGPSDARRAAEVEAARR